VLGYDQNKNLVTLNDDVKSNLRQYLDQYRILTDTIQILDAFVVNISITFSIVVFKNYNMNDVLTRCISAVQQFFIIDKWSINQPIAIADINTTIASVDGVQSLTNVQVGNLYSFINGSDYSDFIYDVNAATINGIIYPSLDPMVFEVRYPQTDIIGSATQ